MHRYILRIHRSYGIGNAPFDSGFVGLQVRDLLPIRFLIVPLVKLDAHLAEQGLVVMKILIVGSLKSDIEKFVRRRIGANVNFLRLILSHNVPLAPLDLKIKIV